MKVHFHDWETYYNTRDNYSLSKMTPAEYILDPRFEPIGLAVMEGLDGTPYWVEGPDLPRYFEQADPNVAVGSHHWEFDGSIASWRYGYLPKLSFCTLSMCRAVFGHFLKYLSLASVAKALNLPPKGNTVHKVDGMNLAMIKAAGIYDEYVDYSLHDDWLCANIFRYLTTPQEDTGKPLFPLNELLVLDAVLRCVTEPRFILDRNVLAEHLYAVQQEKEQLLARIGVDRSIFMSNDKFAAALKLLGVEPPMKTSPTTGQTTYAFAKTDVDFLELLEHDNPQVQALVAARMGLKSTLEETRTQRFIDISHLTWPSNDEPLMPIPLQFSGAKRTHRLSGGWKLNAQNMSRGNPIKPGSGRLRKSLAVKRGYKVVTADAAQIEARKVVFFSGQDDVVEQFRNGEDVYAILASEIYDRPINKKDNPNERFVGKQARLGLGYQLWWPKFRLRVKTDSINQLGYPIELTEDEALNVVTTFRRLNDKVIQAWEHLEKIGIPVLVHGGDWEWGACRFSKGKITGPTGLAMHYPDLTLGVNKFGRESWFFTTPQGRKDIYGGKLMENICQHLARCHTLDAAVRIQKRSTKELGQTYRLAQQAHDENVFIVQDEHVEEMQQILLEEMCRQDWWCPGFPFAAEVGIGQNYGEAK